jgi:hypothetical protein
MKKRILSLALAVTMLLVLIPAALANPSAVTVDGPPDPGDKPDPGGSISTGDVDVGYTVEDGGVTLDLDDDTIDELIDSAGDGEVVFDLSDVEDAVSVSITAEAAQAFSEADVSLTIVLPGAEITLDPEALAILCGAAETGGDAVTLEAFFVDADDLDDVLAIQAGDGIIISINVFVGGDKVNVPLTVTLPYALKDGEDAAGVCVWYIDGLGTLVNLNGVFADGFITFTIPHQSFFIVGYDEAIAAWDGRWSDVEDHEYFDAIAFAAWYQTAGGEPLFSGMGDGSIFAPDETMTRGMFVTLLYKLAGRPDTKELGVNPFSDVEDGKWYYEAILWAAGEGIVSGKPDGIFDPYSNITREEMAAAFNQYAAAFDYEIEKLRDLPDVLTFSDWADVHVKPLGEAGMLTSGGFDLAEDATRAEIAQMVKDFILFIAD